MPPKHQKYTHILFTSKNYEHADNEKLYCDACNIVVKHTRKDTVDKHLSGKSHINKVLNSTETEENRLQRMQTKATLLTHRTAAELSSKELTTDICDVFVKANIPVNKLDHPAVREDDHVTGQVLDRKMAINLRISLKL